MIRFGPSGNSKLFYDSGLSKTVQAPKWLASQGLDAYEYSFGRGINISDVVAMAIGQEAQCYGIEISVHAPYYINFANPSDDMAQKSYDYVLNSARKLLKFDGNRIVFHPATVGSATRDEAYQLTLRRIETLVEKIIDNGLERCRFCPETMGKINQIGTLQEITQICKIHPCLIPAIDFGHLNARTYGGIKTYEDYQEIIEYLLQHLGYDKTNNMHVHFSKIEYSKGGEVRHLTFEDNIYGPEFGPLAQVLHDYDLHPFIICESDNTQSIDALTMKNLYNNAHKSI